MQNDKLIYTVITGDYDEPKRCPQWSGYDYLLITDNADIKANGWPIKVIEKQEDSCKLQRYWKINSHLIGNYNQRIYFDGSMELSHDVNAIIKKYHIGDITIMTHPSRKCIIAESQAIIDQKKDNFERVRIQIGKYISEGLPFNFGMFATGFMIRNNTENVKEFEKAWWKEVSEHSHRDQLSVTYAQWKNNIDIKGIDYNTCMMYFKIHAHTPKKDINIFYSNPYSVKKNIGKALNDFCALVPNDEDWIVIQDGDMIYLTPDWGQKIHDSLALDGHKYGLIGCYTNRLRSTHQLHEGKFSNDHDIKNHYEIAKKYTENGIIETNAVAGVFMAFQKKTWKKCGGFEENSIVFDSKFNAKIRKLGLKIGLIKSLYVYHLYRVWSEIQPENDTRHLK